jgi:hypothetical protein
MSIKNFPYERGESIYLMNTNWHYVGTVHEVNKEDGIITLYPAIHIISTDNAKDIFTKGLRKQAKGGEDKYEVLPVIAHVKLGPEWACMPYLHPVETVDYEVNWSLEEGMTSLPTKEGALQAEVSELRQKLRLNELECARQAKENKALNRKLAKISKALES